MKSLDNKKLILVLVALVAIFVIARVFRSPRLEGNLPETLVAADTATADVIRLYPRAANGEQIEFRRSGKNWTVQHASAKTAAAAELSSVKSMLGYLAKLVPQRVVTRKKEKYDGFQVGDSTTRVVLLQGEKVLAELRVGRTDFNPAAMNQQSPFGGGGFGGAFTYVRPGDDEQVYAVDGFLEPAFNRNFDDWRDKSLLRLRQADVIRVRFDYPDSAFVLERKNSGWVVDGAAADSTNVKNFLGSMEFRNANGFADDFSASTPTFSISFEGEKGALAVIKGWRRDADVVLGSSIQPGMMFTIGLRDALMARKEDFLAGEK